MRRRVVVGLAGALALLCALLLTFQRRTLPPPTIGLSVVGYREQGNSLVATVSLTNTGTGTVVYEAWGSIPYGWLKEDTGTGWTNRDLAPRFTGSAVIVPAGSSETFSIHLPRAVQHWKCGFGVRSACLRERVAGQIFRKQLPRWLYSICGWLLERIPYRPEHEKQFESDTFNVNAAAHNPAGAVDAPIARLFACEWHWWRATDQQRSAHGVHPRLRSPERASLRASPFAAIPTGRRGAGMPASPSTRLHRPASFRRSSRRGICSHWARSGPPNQSVQATAGVPVF